MGWLGRSIRTRRQFGANPKLCSLSDYATREKPQSPMLAGARGVECQWWRRRRRRRRLVGGCSAVGAKYKSIPGCGNDPKRQLNARPG
jgi:hypothetical protein